MQRRHFLQSLPALAALPQLSHTLTAPPRVALIGTGWYGKMDLWRLLQISDITEVALCDVDRAQLDEADRLLRQKFPRCKITTYTDHRELLDRERPNIALIETPDHWHALQAIDALRAGAHLYLQKPTGRDVLECAAILDAARQHERTVQVALQRRSTPHLIEAKRRFVDSGRLGEVHHVEMCCYYHMRDGAQRPEQPVPPGFDYARYTGPAPLLPFRGIPHRRWRSFRAYGNGIVGDMCVHMYDTVRWLLDLGWPAEVRSSGGIYVDKAADATITDTQHAVFSHPQLDCVWQHRSWGPPVDDDYPWAFFLYGTKGTLKGSTRRATFIPHDGPPEELPVVYERDAFPMDVDEADIELHVAPAIRAHLRDFLGAIATGRRPVADVEEGYISSASCLLANLSRDLGRPLRYDPRTRTIPNDPEATAALRRPYHNGYTHPATRT